MNLNSQQQPQSQVYSNQQQQPLQEQYNRQPSLNSSQGSKQSNVPSRSLPQSLDLMREKKLIGEYQDLDEPIRPQFPHEFYTNVNCHPE
jgi:hypothetical protein